MARLWQCGFELNSLTAGGGMISDIAVAEHYGTNNSPLTFQILSGAGTVDWKATYFAGTA